MTIGTDRSHLNVLVHTDGDNEPTGLKEIIAAWKSTWDSNYSSFSDLTFSQGINLKQSSLHSGLSTVLRQIIDVRNPDVYFTESRTGIELGGVEITTHSPDGSNVEKRYPYIWISRRVRTHAFVVSPYSKRRTGGEINKLPYRHSQRNLAFATGWQPTSKESSLQQILPLLELQTESAGIPDQLRSLLLSWSDIGTFFAHALALKTLSEEAVVLAKKYLLLFQQRLLSLIQECMKNTTHTEPSTLIRLPDKWVQIYNCRPDSGHWERGEGQFDSIDGRLMFTLDEISLLDPAQRPNSFEFWLPQMSVKHPWIFEQTQRSFGSKRLRNILVILKDYCTTRFAEDLTHEDWIVLEGNGSLLLERLDWKPGLYKVIECVPEALRASVARQGLKNPPRALTQNVLNLLNDKSLFFSAHRAYVPNWREDLLNQINKIPIHARVIIPRIPRSLLSDDIKSLPHQLSCGDECTKEQLLMLRQIHRTMKQTISVYEG